MKNSGCEVSLEEKHDHNKEETEENAADEKEREEAEEDEEEEGTLFSRKGRVVHSTSRKGKRDRKEPAPSTNVGSNS